MTRLSGILVVALIALLVAWSVGQAAAAAAMSLEMPTADDRAMDMADCGGCPSDEAGDKAGPLCDLVCLSPILANLTVSQEFATAPAVTSHAPRAVSVLVGRTSSPDPHPPRTALLI